MCLSLGQHSEGGSIIVRRFAHGKVRLDLANLLLRITNDRQVAKTQEVHLQKAQLLDGSHGVLGDDGIVIARQRHIGIHGIGGNDNTGCMGGGVSGHTLEAACGINKQFDPIIFLVHGLQLGRDLQSLV